MCDAPATSREHVPPKCLFPEEKDLPDGVRLRKNLFKVPSCDSHNSQKSHDDEFFLYVLSTSYQINEIGLNHYRTKVRRAAKRNTSILGKIASSAKPLSFIDPMTKKSVSSVTHKLEPERFNMIIDRLARAIYFCHYQNKWLFNIRYQAEFLFATENQEDEENLRLIEITKKANEWFSGKEFFGDNPEVFKYQAMETDHNRLMRLHFYEGCKLLLIFNCQPQFSPDRG
jgi:hypothetical protein